MANIWDTFLPTLKFISNFGRLVQLCFRKLWNLLTTSKDVYKYLNNTGVSAYDDLYGSASITPFIFLCRGHIFLSGLCYVDGETDRQMHLGTE